MKFENSKHRNETSRFYCEGCKRKVLTDDIFVEYRSLINDLRKENAGFYELYRNNNPAVHYLESDDVDSEDSNEETNILLKEIQTEMNNKASENIQDKELEIEILKCEIVRLNKTIDNTKQAKKSMDDCYSESAFTLAMKRLPALYLTLTIELIGGIIISYFEDVIKKYTLLVSFMPALSALSGTSIYLLKLLKKIFI